MHESMMTARRFWIEHYDIGQRTVERAYILIGDDGRLDRRNGVEASADAETGGGNTYARTEKKLGSCKGK